MVSKTVQILRTACATLDSSPEQTLNDEAFLEALVRQYPKQQLFDKHFTAGASRLGGHNHINTQIISEFGLPFRRTATMDFAQTRTQEAVADVVGILSVLSAITIVGGGWDLELMEDWIVNCMQAAGESGSVPSWTVLHRDVCAPGALSVFIMARKQGRGVRRSGHKTEMI